MQRTLFLLAASCLAPALFAADPANKDTLNAGAVGKVVEVKLKDGVVMKFCYCPAGNFTMGSPEEEEERDTDEKQVPVRMTKGFWLAQTECTQGQWEALMGNNPSWFKGAALPVEMVSWEEAQAYLGKLNQTAALPEGWKFALPTEAQWEYACRAGTQTVFSFGDSLTSLLANFDGNHPYGTTTKSLNLDKTAPVGSYAANGWGLHDMHGNVAEWCEDWYAEELSGGADPAGAKEGVYRVYRGGCWGLNAAYCRAAFRYSVVPDFCNLVLGFRPALVPSK